MYGCVCVQHRSAEGKKERKKQRQKEECVDGRGSSQRSVRLYGCLYGTYLTTIHCTLYAPTNGKIV